MNAAMNVKPRLFVISGPAGVGKGTLIGRACTWRPDLELSVSATTRPPRRGEVDGVSYHFLTDAEFESRVQAGEFLEWASVHGHRYGTLKSEVEGHLDRGHSVILEIDYQGAHQVRQAVPEAVLIFIEPPSMVELERRLRGRATESEAQIELRLSNARREMIHAESYDVRIINDDIGRATSELLDVIASYESAGGTNHNVCR